MQTQAQTRTMKRRGRRGMAMVGTMVVLLGIMALVLLGMVSGGAGGNKGGGGVLTTTSNALQSASAREQTVTAFNLAESGVTYARVWLGQQSAPPPDVKAFAPGYGQQKTTVLWGSSLSAGSPPRAVVNYPDAAHTFSVTIYPDSDNTSATAFQHAYMVEAIGVCGGATQILHVYVQQTSFGHYAYFLDNWAANGYWVSGLSVFDGPMHCNNTDGNPANILWKNAAGSNPKGVIWTYTGRDAFTTRVATKWNLNSVANYVNPASEADWLMCAAGGSKSVQDGTASSVPLPSASTAQRTAAVGSAAIPASSGITVASDGGIYIHCKNGITTATGAEPAAKDNNDVQKMTLSVDGSGRQVITVTQNSDAGALVTTALTLDTANHQTLVSVNGGAQSAKSGGVNGVVYCDGNIGKQSGIYSGTWHNYMSTVGNSSSGKTLGLSGTLADRQQLTIATDIDNNMNLSGSVSFHTPRTSGNWAANAGTLGLVSDNVEVLNNDNSGAALTNVEIDADVLAYNQYDAVDYSTRSPGGGGKFVNFGGYVAKNFGFFGLMNLSGVLQTGLAPTFTYDTRLGANPPPFFPLTSNQYDLVSWQRVGSTLE